MTQRVDAVVLSNLDAAYRLARWHFRNEREAEDVVREASLRAVREFVAFSTGTARVWFLRIVSRVCTEWRERSPEGMERLPPLTDDPSSVEEAIRSLPARLREALVLREVEGLSYQELADVMDVSVETAMASLSRSRQALGHALARQHSVAV
jgi:RNA polymerase sigma-70 factor (ECF subfamily)